MMLAVQFLGIPEISQNGITLHFFPGFLDIVIDKTDWIYILKLVIQDFTQQNLTTPTGTINNRFATNQGFTFDGIDK